MFFAESTVRAYAVEIAALVDIVIGSGFFRNETTVSEQIGQAVIGDDVSHFQGGNVENCESGIGVESGADVAGALAVHGRVEEPAQSSG